MKEIMIGIVGSLLFIGMIIIGCLCCEEERVRQEERGRIYTEKVKIFCSKKQHRNKIRCINFNDDLEFENIKL